MGIVVVKEQGVTVKMNDGRLLLAKGGKVFLDYPIAQVERLLLYGSIQVSTQVMKYLMENGIDIGFITTKHRLVGWCVSEKFKGFQYRLMQYKLIEHNEKSIQMANWLVTEKWLSQKKCIEKWRGMVNVKVITEYNHLAALHNALVLPTCANKEVIRGFEGRCSKLYFDLLYLQLDSRWLNGVNQRRHDSPWNSMLNLGYALLEIEIVGLCSIYGLDVAFGCLHDLSYGRKSLVYDLMEPLRASIVDCFLIELVQNELVEPDDFTQTEEGFRLSEAALGIFFEKWYQRIAYGSEDGVIIQKMLENVVLTFRRNIDDGNPC